jgi:UDP-galactopyranose mutase
MTRCARDRRVFYIEEPVTHRDIEPRLHVERVDGITLVVPELPEGLSPEASEAEQTRLLDRFVDSGRSPYVLWYYTPMALGFSAHWAPQAIVYDCMDELSLFKGASPLLKEREAELMRRADLVLTGGQSLFEAKRHAHENIHAFPSSVDVSHFGRARSCTSEPDDQASIPRPRLGFFGVIDERMDLDLIAGVAAARPDWQIVLLGPVVKIDPESLPKRPNLHYLGAKSYAQLPDYLAGWDVALMPFARNDATRFISPTKTPEYMAAGAPVVSTSIRDVVRPYGQQGLVRIADDVPSFVQACVDAMADDRHERITQADAFLRQTSWDGTWNRIRVLLDDVLHRSESRAGQRAAGGTTIL